MVSQEKVQQLQLLQQNLQNLQVQKQQFQSQLSEIDGALTELKKTEKAYKIIGKVMLSASKEDLTKELQQKKEIIDIRLKNFGSQEEKLQKIMEEIQKEAMEELKRKKK